MLGIREFSDEEGNRYIVDLSQFNRRVFVNDKLYTPDCLNSDEVPDFVKELLTTSSLSVEVNMKYKVITDKRTYKFKRLSKL